MKRVLLLVTIVVVAVLIFGQSASNTTKPSVIYSPSPTPKQLTDRLTYTYHGAPFSVAWLTVQSGQRVKLFENFGAKLTASQFQEVHHCKALTNAGFYTPNRSPVGLLAIEGNVIQSFQSNALFNGILMFNQNGEVKISEAPSQSLWTAIQTGPILFQNGQPVALRLTQDELARRVVAAITPDGSLILLTFYTPDNVYQGPFLTDLPTHLSLFSQKSHIPISAAINLDGGSASVFITPDTTLTELVPVGSFLCVY